MATPTTKHVFEHTKTPQGSQFSCAYVDARGLLVLQVHDMGGMFGEYESFETYTAEQTARWVSLLGNDLIAAIAARFSSTADVSAFARSEGIGRGELWSRSD
jgi:hypothetical protein